MTFQSEEAVYRDTEKELSRQKDRAHMGMYFRCPRTRNESGARMSRENKTSRKEAGKSLWTYSAIIRTLPSILCEIVCFWMVLKENAVI